MQLGDYADVVRRRWRVVLSSVLVVVAAVAGWSVLSDAAYRSTTVLSPLPVGEARLSASDAVDVQTLGQQRLPVYAGLVADPGVLASIADRLGRGTSARDVQDAVTASVDPEAGLLTVTADGASAEQARAAARATAEVLVQEARARETPLLALSVVQDAELPRVALGRSPVTAAALAIALGLFVGFLAALAREATDSRLRDVDDVVRATRFPVVGTVPVPRQGRSGALVTAEESAQAEALRHVHDRLRGGLPDSGGVVLVAGPSAGSGATGLALGLAASLASAGREVLLVDCDLRTVTGLSAGLDAEGLGLRDVLAGTLTWQRAAGTSGPDGLRVLAAGQADLPVGRLLDGPTMAALVHELRGAHDVVVLDAPPLLAQADAVVLARLVDAAVLVVTAGTTRGREAAEAAERLRHAAVAWPMGVVVRRTRRRRSQRSAVVVVSESRRRRARLASAPSAGPGHRA